MSHLTDDSRMMQLRMHLTGEAERAIMGLGSSGKMYHAALKMLKEQFGCRSIVARTCIDKLIRGPKIGNFDRRSLRDLSLDIVSRIATLNRIDCLADVNASDESLRQIVKRLPDHMILKWKGVAAQIRERDQLPNLSHISDLLRKQVKADFDLDFGDLACDRADERSSRDRQKSKDVHATSKRKPQDRRPIKCYVCASPHRVTDCPTFMNSSPTERFKIVKKRCGKNGCTRVYHPLIHFDPPSSGAVSTLDRDGILPAVRVTFRAGNGRVRECNVLIDSGAATTIIRREFAKALGLQGKREPLEISVVGGGRLKSVKFWISPLSGGEDYEIEGHEIDRTILSVAPLDRQWLSLFPHISDLEFSGPVDLIIGVQQPISRNFTQLRKSTCATFIA